MKRIDKSLYDRTKFIGVEKSMMEAAYHALTFVKADSDKSEPSEADLLRKVKEIIKAADDATIEEAKTEEK